LITCNLTKLESAVDQFRKLYAKLAPADAGIMASALSLTGRHALAIYDDVKYQWPDDNEKLMEAMSSHLQAVSESIEASAPAKKTKTAVVEEEPVTINIGLAPNLAAGELVLNNREDLKTLLSDVLKDGVEFVYSPSDIGWQWALDRANWSTISGGELSRRIKIKANFTEGAVGTETGTSTKKRAAKKEAEVKVDDVIVEDIDIPEAIVEAAGE
jgi:hypothetical protein